MSDEAYMKPLFVHSLMITSTKNKKNDHSSKEKSIMIFPVLNKTININFQRPTNQNETFTISTMLASFWVVEKNFSLRCNLEA